MDQSDTCVPRFFPELGEGELSERQRQVAALAAEGLDSKTIAQQLGIKHGTIKNHMSAIFAKCGVTNRQELTLFVWSHGLHDFGPAVARLDERRRQNLYFRCYGVPASEEGEENAN